MDDEELPAELCFPPPPSGWETAELEQVATYVDAIASWRDALVHVLRYERELLPDDLSDYAADMLLDTLAGTGREPAPDSGYFVGPFPATVEPTRASLVELMRWRAGFAEWVADLWEMDAPPRYDVFECEVMLELLRPVDAAERCLWCLDAEHESAARECSIFAFIRSCWPDD